MVEGRPGQRRDGRLTEAPFQAFADGLRPQSGLRAAITAARHRPEPDCVGELLEAARLPPGQARDAQALAQRLARRVRERVSGSGREGLVQGLIQEFALSSQEGVALMCLAEALLRIPDAETRDALIRDKIGGADWRSHLGGGGSLFVNAATWGLILTGRLLGAHEEPGLPGALGRVLARGGEPVIRRGVDRAMRLMGEQFVVGETIDEALANARPREARGFRHSYDMLGEAAMTDADAQRYLAAYEQAIHAIGKAAAGRGIVDGPGVSIKLSALHPRYGRAQYERAMAELYPRLLGLARLARRYELGLNIDAEEADRLDLSLDLLERLCHEPELAGWDGLGFVVQAYQKRCSLVVDWLIELARRGRRRLMVRLVKGAYWDTEIKRAQLAGLDGYPVYTRKAYTDLAYLACARKLLAAPEAAYPQFATHNAQTLAAIVQMAGDRFRAGQYEFQCLYGMGETLYEQIVRPPGDGGLGRPCRIYAPVGTHRTLLAYLVRRLLENGANTSFVNRIADEAVPIEALVADPVATVTAMAAAEGALGLPHPAIPLPGELYGSRRRNSAGIDLSSEDALAALAPALVRSGDRGWRAGPLIGDPAAAAHAHAGVDEAPEHPGDSVGPHAVVDNPADRRDEVGEVVEASLQDIADASETAARAASVWATVPALERAACLERAGERIEARTGEAIGLLVREGGKTIAAALAEVREAVDFLRYYAARLRADPTLSGGRPLGPVVCISPWNFPLAIFTGQVAAALAAGNTVLAKPAEQTPLVAAEAVRLLHEAGVPREALQLLPGAGESVGAALVADSRIRGVLFTGSTEVARTLQRALAGRLDEHGQPPVLVAETGGQNAMIVDSSALIEQAVGDILVSAFDSAGQRCSALRVLCVQDDIAERLLTMLRGAMRELRIGSPQRLSTDIGPVIDAEARRKLLEYIERMRTAGHRVYQPLDGVGPELANGSFVPPTLIELDGIADLGGEVFGPVLHVVRFRRRELGRLVEQIDATGYGLTLGIHTRIDETVDFVTGRARVGNQYVNRNMIGAVVGVQPFGGDRLSGTGPKAGGPLYLYRLLRGANPLPSILADAPPPSATSPPPSDTSPRRSDAPPLPAEPSQPRPQALEALRTWLESAPCGELRELAPLCAELACNSLLGLKTTLPGPTGERNSYLLLSRTAILCIADNDADMLFQLAHVLAAGTSAVWPENARTQQLHARLPAAVRQRVRRATDPVAADFDAALVHGEPGTVRSWSRRLARRDGPIVGLQACARGERRIGAIRLDALMVERSLSVDTTAAGGNASLLTIG